AGAHRARHPVERAQLVDDRALDARHRVRLELDVASGVVALDGADQPEQPVRDEIALVDVCRQARAEPTRDVLDERRVRQDQTVANALVAVAAILEPEALGVRIPGHSIREYELPAEFPHGTPYERGHPERERRRSGRDRPPSGGRTRDRDPRECEREHGEERGERYRTPSIS